MQTIHLISSEELAELQMRYDKIRHWILKSDDVVDTPMTIFDQLEHIATILGLEVRDE